MSKITASAAGPFAAAIEIQEVVLKARLVAGGPLVALEMETALAEYRRMATALRITVEQQPPADDISDEFIREQFARQLAKDADILAANAEARAAHTLRGVQGIWRGTLDGERQRQRWARIHAAQAGGTR